MRSSRPAISRLRRGILLVALVAGCDDAPAPPGRLERPALHWAPGAPAPAPERVRALPFPPDLGGWGVSGRSARVRQDPAGGSSLAFGPGETVLLAVPGDFPSTSFDQIRLRGLFPGNFQVALRLSTGERHHRTRSKVTVALGVAQTLVFDLFELRADPAPYDTLEVYVKGTEPGLELHAIELVDVPAGHYLPAVDGEGGTVEIAGEARAAVGLPAHRPLQCRFTVEHPGDRLEFAVGLPRHLRPRPGRGAGDPRLTVVLTARGAAVLEHRVALAGRSQAPGGWHPVTLDLAPLVGREVTATFEYGAEAPGPGACALANVRVWRPDPSPTPPTVVLISSDTHRADHLGSARSGVSIQTPSLDALADRGLVFERCWATTNVTSPSHVAMMTGVHPRDTRLVSNLDRLSPAAHTLAEAFREAGWATYAVISVRHLGPEATDAVQGFDRLLAPPGDPWPAAVAVDRALSWIEEAAGRPAFLFVHLFDAHHPYAPPPPYDRLYYPPDRDPADPSLPPLQVRPGSIPADLIAGGLRDLEYPKAQYRGEITYMDRELGRLLAHPRVASGLVAMTADHGEILEKDGTYFNHGEIYPDTLHVPLVLGGEALPADLRGRRSPAPVTHLDLGRTLLDLAGLTGVEFPGTNLLATLGQPPQREAPRFALAAHGFSASVTRHGWYLLLHLRDHQETLARERHAHEIELFDLAADPECLRNLAAQEPEKAAALRERLVAWLAEAAPRGLARRRFPSTEELERLAELGYASGAPSVEEEPWYDPQSR